MVFLSGIAFEAEVLSDEDQNMGELNSPQSPLADLVLTWKPYSVLSFNPLISAVSFSVMTVWLVFFFFPRSKCLTCDQFSRISMFST